MIVRIDSIVAQVLLHPPEMCWLRFDTDKPNGKIWPALGACAGDEPSTEPGSEFGHRECVLCFEHGLKESNPFKNLFLIDAGKLAGDRAVRRDDVAIKCRPSELT